MYELNINIMTDNNKCKTTLYRRSEEIFERGLRIKKL